MKLINFKNLLLLPALALPIFLFSQESDQEEVNPYEVLLDAINKNADVEKQFDIKRFNTIEAKVIELRNIKIKLTNDLRAAEELSDQLSAEFDDNESQLSELEEKLTLKLGNLGEMFGVVRQVAGQTKGEFENEKIHVSKFDYYYSNVIARASKTMSECRNSLLKLKKTGTEG